MIWAFSRSRPTSVTFDDPVIRPTAYVAAAAPNCRRAPPIVLPGSKTFSSPDEVESPWLTDRSTECPAVAITAPMASQLSESRDGRRRKSWIVSPKSVENAGPGVDAVDARWTGEATVSPVFVTLCAGAAGAVCAVAAEGEPSTQTQANEIQTACV